MSSICKKKGNCGEIKGNNGSGKSPIVSKAMVPLLAAAVLGYAESPADTSAPSTSAVSQSVNVETASVKGNSGSAFSEGASRWFGLDFSAKSYHGFGSESRVGFISLNSITRFLPGKQFILGPNYNLTLLTLSNEKARETVKVHDIGLEIGYCATENVKAVPYFIVRPIFSLATARYDTAFETEPNLKIEIKTGCIAFVNKVVGIQIEPNYLMQPLDEIGSFGINLGIACRFNDRMFSLGTMNRSVYDYADVW